MKIQGLIVGLGNPGNKYKKTRHNIGFMVINNLLDNSSDSTCLPTDKDYSLWVWRDVQTKHPWLLCKPLTYMNLSGRAIKKVIQKYMITDPSQILVIHDELDFSLGQVRFKYGGGCAGHKGLLSITEYLGTFDFYRLRMGIGRPEKNQNLINYVLSNFESQEIKSLSPAIERSIVGIRTFCQDGIEPAMKEIHSPLQC